MAELSYLGGELAMFAHAHNWKRYLARALSPYLRGHVLEVGAGLGTTTRALIAAPEIRAWTALEPDSTLLASLKTTTAELSRARAIVVRAQGATLGELPATPAFDTILYVDVLEHIEHDRRELELAVERLLPGGQIVVLAPAHQELFSAFDAQVGHFRRYDKPSLRALTPSGTRLVALRYYDCVGVVASLANRLLLRSALPSARQIKLWDSAMVPLSRVLDRVTFGMVGKSVLAVWRR